MSWLDRLAEIRKTDWTQIPDGEREAMALEVVTIASYAAAAASLVPVPLVDVALLLPVHTAMVMTIGHVHGRNLSDAEAKRVALELGAVAGVTLAGRAALSALKKVLLPGLGGFLAAPASFAVTYALGRVANIYFKDPSATREDLKQAFSDAFKEGKASFQEEKLDEHRASDDEADVVDVESAPSTSAAGTNGGADGSESSEGKLRTKKRSL